MQTYHDFVNVVTFIDPQTMEEVRTAPLLKSDKQVEVPMDINVACHDDNEEELDNEAEVKKQSYTLTAVVEHIGKVQIGFDNTTLVYT